MGQGKLARAASDGTGIYLFLGSSLAALAAAWACIFSEPLGVLEISSSLVSLFLIHSYRRRSDSVL